MNVPAIRRAFVFIFIGFTAGISLAKKPQTWTTVKSPNFIVLTNANEKQGRRVAYQFEMIRAVFRQFFNLKGSNKDQPVTIIAAQDEQTLKALLPESWAVKGSSHPAGYYLRGLEKSYVALRLDVIMGNGAVEPFEPIYHEYVHYLTRRMVAQLPLWMVEGMAEFYGNTRIEAHQVFVGTPSPSNLMVLRRTQPLPLAVLFAVNHSSPYYHEQNKTSIFYAQSWALMHLLITRDWREGTHHTNDFMVLLGQNVSAEEAARRTIGSLPTLQEALSQYIGRLSFTAARLEAPPGISPSDFQAEAASDAVSLAVRADFMARDRHYQEAKAMVEEALKSDPKLAEAHATMGFIVSREGKMDEATTWYAQAVALNSQSCLANYYYAMSLFKGKLNNDAAEKAESSLRSSIKVAPQFAPAYSALGWLLATRHKNLDEAYLMTTTAVGLEPGEVHYRLNAAEVFEMMGQYDNAVRVAKIAAAMAKTIEDENAALAIVSNVQQRQEYEKKSQEQVEALRKEQAEAIAARAGAPRQAEKVSPPTQEDIASGPDSGQPPALRHRDGTSDGNGPAVPVRGVALTAHPLRPELLPIRRVVEGTIKNVMCIGGSTLEMTLSSTGRVLQLYSDNYLKIPYSALNFQPQGVLNPCTGVEGWHARVTYHPSKGQASQGEMLEVGFLKN